MTTTTIPDRSAEVDTTAAEAPPTRFPRIARILASLAVLVGALFGTSIITAPAASAMQYYNAHGWHGGITPYKVSHYDHWTAGPVRPVVMAGLLIGGPAVTRSNGSAGAQTVEVAYQITRHHANGFTSQQLVQQWYTISATAGWVKLPDLRLSATATGGTFSVRIGLEWYDQAGRLLGGRAIAYNGYTNDYTCTYSHYVKCWVNNGSITINTG